MLRIKLFSKKEDKDKDKETNKSDSIKAGLSLATGVGLVAGSNKMGDKITDRYIKKLNKVIVSKTTDNENKVKGALIKHAKEKGIEIISDPGFDNSAYVGGGIIGKTGRKIYDKLKKSNPQQAKKLKDMIEKEANNDPGIMRVTKHLGKDAVILGSGDLSKPEVLAHELGHASLDGFGKKRSKDVVGKIAHVVSPASKLIGGLNGGSKILSSASAVGFTAGGFRRGAKSVDKDEEGKIKVDKKKLLKSSAIGIAATAPILIMEGAASRKGLKLMKGSGANKETLDKGKKTLRAALGTYVGQAIKPALYETGGHLAGVGYGILREKRKKHKKEEETK